MKNPQPYSFQSFRWAAIALLSFCPSHSILAAPRPNIRLDFGSETSVPGYKTCNATQHFSEATGYGWLDTEGLDLRDRGNPDDLRRDFVMGRNPQVFRIAGLQPGRYLLKVVSGDTDYGDHTTRIKLAAHTRELPLMAPGANEFHSLSFTIDVKETLELTFESPQNNWVVNALSLEPTTVEKAPSLLKDVIKPEPMKSTWNPKVFENDPTRALLENFRKSSPQSPPNFKVTGIKREDYLKLISSEVDFWKQHQNSNGAIIDPYRKEEYQYSTPAFAHAAALLVARQERADLLEPAAKAMDWASKRLSLRQAATTHEDFYPPMLAQTFALLKGQVKPERVARWEADIRSFDPYRTYRQGLGQNNWNVVSSSGEVMFQKLGLRDKSSSYSADSFAAQGHHFRSSFGLYLEGPMAYDHFPRIFLADVIAQGYEGPYHTQLREALRRAAITSLFMQSPWGEIPAGGRSAHHQWNEAEQCVTYEIYAAQAQKEGDAQLAGIYKRAAHLALASMQRWVRPSGEMQIIKNWVDPAQRHSFEAYSAHSQYNLLPMSMLARAYEYAAETKAIGEKPSPADVGGFVLEVQDLHKVFANAGGTYIEIDTRGDSHYDATGLIRVHMKGVSPQLGPSDSLLAHASYQSPAPAPMTTGIGVSWQDAAGKWRNLSDIDPKQIKNVKVTPILQSPNRVVFDVVYEGEMAGVSRITEHYVLTPSGVELSTECVGALGELRYVWPVLADDGRTQSKITVQGNIVSVSQAGSQIGQTFEVRNGQGVVIEPNLYSNHNGWAHLAVAKYSQADRVTLVMAPKLMP